MGAKSAFMLVLTGKACCNIFAVGSAGRSWRKKAGVSVLRSPQNGKKITWLPIVASVRNYSIQNEIGRAVDTLRLGEVEGGVFSSDGVARIFPLAFDNPAMLA